MPSAPESRQRCRVAASLFLALGLVLAPVGDACAASATAGARTARQKPAAKSKPATPSKPAAAQLDSVTELEVISDEARALWSALEANPDDAQARQKLAELALRATRAAERAFSRGDEILLGGYRSLIRRYFGATRAGLEGMARRGIGSAEFALGVLALPGMLEDGNIQRACARFAAALDKGFSGARFRHARCIEESDPVRARALMQEAADAGHAGAIEHLGRACLEAKPPDAPCAYTLLERASREGRPSATTLLGWMHAQGIGGRVDLPRAMRLYREAAQKGEPSALNNLGELYEAGRGVDKDPARAFDYYLSAALSGFPPAQFNVGRLYAAGKGTTKNPVEARRWLGVAAEAGVAPARNALDVLDQEAGTAN